MPLYEYQCEACGTRVEKIQKFSDPPLATCTACGGAMRKLPSSPAIQFKGTGWYITDYAKKTAVEGTTGAGSNSAESRKGESSKGDAPKGDAAKSDAAKSDSAGTGGGASSPSGAGSGGGSKP
jgi:putative FmdB family regulatory protein